MEEEAKILEPFELRYSDLILLSSNEALSSAFSSEDIQRLESITRRVMEELGPRGPGLLAIAGVPNVSNLRQTLLPLARKLSLLNNDDRKRVLKEHSLGSDVPLKNLDRTVSSFAMQIKYIHALESTPVEASVARVNSRNTKQDCSDGESLGEFHDREFTNLGYAFKELGFCMMELGLRLARICDRVIGGQELEQSLLESYTAKGRLIHYHSTLDNLIMKEAAKRKGSTKQQSNYNFLSNEQTNSKNHETKSCYSLSNLWQQWHYDYGIFTVLTAPMFILSSHQQTRGSISSSCIPIEQEYPCPNGHIYLQIFDPNKNCVLMVKASPQSFIIQVGESADIISRGKLRSSLHSVCRPTTLENLSRETFVVFLQPAWSKTFPLSDYPIKHLNSGGQQYLSCTEETCIAKPEQEELMQEIQKTVPPLSSRLKDGMTFAEFSRETTKQYYGGSGLQSKR